MGLLFVVENELVGEWCVLPRRRHCVAVMECKYVKCVDVMFTQELIFPVYHN